MIRWYSVYLLCLTVATGFGLAHRPEPHPPMCAFEVPTKELRTEIDFKPGGCFHNEHYKITIWRNSSWSVRVAKVEPVFAGDSLVSYREQFLWQDSLTREEGNGIERLWDFYRSNLKGDCTTGDKIDVVQYVDGQAVRTEHFVDPPGCGSLASVANQYDSKDIQDFLDKKYGKEWRSVTWLQTLIEKALRAANGVANSASLSSATDQQSFSGGFDFATKPRF